MHQLYLYSSFGSTLIAGSACHNMLETVHVTLPVWYLKWPMPTRASISLLSASLITSAHKLRSIIYQTFFLISEQQCILSILTTCFRRGGERKTPKNATAHDHRIAFDHVNIIGGEPSFSGSSTDNAGKIPTNPAANGIYNDRIRLQEDLRRCDYARSPWPSTWFVKRRSLVAR